MNLYRGGFTSDILTLTWWDIIMLVLRRKANTNAALEIKVRGWK